MTDSEANILGSKLRTFAADPPNFLVHIYETWSRIKKRLGYKNANN